jgi:hypothetical protein
MVFDGCSSLSSICIPEGGNCAFRVMGDFLV